MPPKSNVLPHGRIVSIDALRGFDMFWIIGGDAFFKALFTWIDTPVFVALARQFNHARWNGFRFEDLIFPLFLFIVGVCMPFSITKRLDRGDSRLDLYRHIFMRTLVLFAFGLLFNGILKFEFDSTRYLGVLQRIALCYLGAALIVMNFRMKGQAAWAAGIMMVYWAVMKLVPVPGFGPAVLTPEGNLAAYIDQLLLPGRFCCYEFGDSEGLLSTLPAVSTTLLGVLCGHWLRTTQSASRKVQGLFVVGVTSTFIAYGWHQIFPINKVIWTSSYVLFTAGLSAILLGFFYWVIDVRGYRKWAFPFVVIGLNPITIYMAQRIINFDDIADFFTMGLAQFVGDLYPILLIAGAFSLKWMFLHFLYRHNLFLKV